MFKNKYLRRFCVLAAMAATTLLYQTPVAAERFSFAAMGDTPYVLPGDFERFGRLIERINSARPAFTIHVGDIKPGNTRCSDEHFARIATTRTCSASGRSPFLKTWLRQSPSLRNSIRVA